MNACLPSIALLADPEPHPAAWNMGLDEALLETALAPVLRFYRWEQRAVSFGCFQPWAEVAARFQGLELVRRPTGGGAVEHGDAGETATYSLVVPRAGGALIALGERPSAAFRSIHVALAEVLAALGVRVALHESDAAPGLGGACFQDRPVPGDLLLPANGRKIAGAAQRRTRAGLLHQGSIRVPGGLDVTQLADGFAVALAGKVTKRLNLTGDASELADELARTKYGQRAWTGRL